MGMNITMSVADAAKFKTWLNNRHHVELCVLYMTLGFLADDIDTSDIAGLPALIEGMPVLKTELRGEK